MSKSQTQSKNPKEQRDSAINLALATIEKQFGKGSIMRLSADKVLVIYKTADDSGAKAGIERLEATGNVVLVSGPDAAEAQRAEYTIDKGTIVMTGNVLLNQEGGTLASNRLEVNLTSGTARMAGRVKTILNPDGGSN